jgi:4-alpha-glucanotransferase
MIPACVPDVMNALSIIGMRIQRMPADPNVEFNNPQHYEYLTVATPGSHDMATIRGWWEEMESGQRQRFYEQMLGRHGEDAPLKCEADIVEQILEQHVSSPSIWAIFLLQVSLVVLSCW